MASGCQGSGSRRAIASSEPGLTSTVEADGVVARSSSPVEPPIKTVNFVDRHPLFSRPRDYWEKSNSNKVVKAAAATFIGVPAGFVGEVKQIIVGAPPDMRY
jgi:hypothetical protein